MLSILFRNLRFRIQEQLMAVTYLIDNGKAKELTRFVPLSRTECSKMKILIWMCKSCLKERQKSKLLVMQVRVGGCK